MLKKKIISTVMFSLVMASLLPVQNANGYVDASCHVSVQITARPSTIQVNGSTFTRQNPDGIYYPGDAFEFEILVSWTENCWHLYPQPITSAGLAKGATSGLAINELKSVNTIANTQIQFASQEAIAEIEASSNAAIEQVNIAGPTSVAEVNTATQAAQGQIALTNQTAIAEIDALAPIATTSANTATGAVNQTVSSILSAPTGLVASEVSPTQILLNWNAPQNTGSLVTGYKIDRSTDGGSTFTTVNATTGTTATEYQDTGLVPNTTYTYRVSAVYAAETSSPSNTASATTAGSVTLSVSAQFTDGSAINGEFCFLLNSTGQYVGTGFTPCSFDLDYGANYKVGISNYGNAVFDHWADNNSTNDPRAIAITSDTSLIAVFKNTG